MIFFNVAWFFLMIILFTIFVVFGSSEVVVEEEVTEDLKEKDIYYYDWDGNYKKYKEVVGKATEEVFINEEGLKNLSKEEIDNLLYLEMIGDIEIIFVTNAGEKANLSKTEVLSIYSDFEDKIVRNNLKIEDILSIKRRKLFKIARIYAGKAKKNVSHSKRNREKFDGRNIPHKDICEEEDKEVVKTKKSFKNEELVKGFIMSEVLGSPVSKRRN